MMRSLTASLLAALALAACSRTPAPAEIRTQDTRTFTAVTPTLTARTGAPAISCSTRAPRRVRMRRAGRRRRPRSPTPSHALPCPTTKNVSSAT